MRDFLEYINYYTYTKVRKQLFERYVANCVGVMARLEKTYDDFLGEIDGVYSKKNERTAEEIKADLLKKFNKESK